MEVESFLADRIQRKRERKDRKKERKKEENEIKKEKEEKEERTNVRNKWIQIFHHILLVFLFFKSLSVFMFMQDKEK